MNRMVRFAAGLVQSSLRHTAAAGVMETVPRRPEVVAAPRATSAAIVRMTIEIAAVTDDRMGLMVPRYRPTVPDEVVLLLR